MQRLKEKVEQIQMPKDMQQRILNHCYEKMEEDFIEKKNIKTDLRNFRKPIIAVVALGLCLCFVGGTVALAGGKQGSFNEIIKRGAGRYNLVYEQATEKVQVEVSADAKGVLAQVTFVDADTLPYIELEAIGLKQYQIVAEDGTVVLEGTQTDVVELVQGKANILLASEQLPSGTYTLAVTQLVAEKKADWPLVITGEWESIFVLK